MKEYAATATTVCVFASMVSAGLWWVVKPHVWPHLKPILELPTVVDEIGRRLADVERGIADQRPADRVSEYDPVRSTIYGPCAVGEWCSGEYRFRRTPEGASCSAPTAEPYVANHYGIKRPVTQYDLTTIRADETWTTSRFKFVVPIGARPGVGEFWFALRYADCGKPITVRYEKTDVLQFQIAETPAP